MIDEEQFNQSLGARLKDIRKSCELSQIFIGDYLGIHQTAICRIETGEQTVTPQQLHHLARLYHLKMDDLINGEARNLNRAVKAFRARTKAK